MKSTRYYIETYGCQANIRDSQRIEEELKELGLSACKDYKTADVVILNSCSVRQKSEDKIYGWGKKLVSPKSPDYTKKGRQVVIVTGCLIGSAKGERTRYPLTYIEKKIPWADYLLAPEEESKIPFILVKENIIASTDLEKLRVNEKDRNTHIDSSGWSYVNISTGCDNFCTFCVVPYARGKEVSRPSKEILHEVNELVRNGNSNIMLLAQNVNSWGLNVETKFKLRAGSQHKIPFADLLESVHKIKGVKKISFLSSNPFDFTQDLIDKLALPKIDRYLHIAVQSGNNEILKKMNRRHTIEEFNELINQIKLKVPDMSFGTDVIVGFPGESNEQFMNTVKLFNEVKFAVAFISIYSPRKGTVSERFMKDDVPLKEKKRRHAYLTKVWKESL